MNKVDIDSKKIEKFLNRGISNIYPSKDFLKEKLKSGKQLKIYLGIDPTGPTLHLGHAIPIKKLSELQKMGHKIIILMGDFTARIGDPTGKSEARKQLTKKQVLDNLKNYKQQANKLISFKGSNKAEFKFNSKWLGKMNFEDVLSLASKMTVQQMLERDMFENRIKEGKPISIHEFMYPLMQGYDSVAMDVDGEIGGNDQTFNMLCGRDLLKQIKNKEKFVITVKLLEDSSGKKMGKTEGNMVALSDKPDEMFGKIMSWADELIVPGFELSTDLEDSEIKDIRDGLKNQTLNPKDAKILLAEKIVSLFYGEDFALKSKNNWDKTFSKKEIPDDIEEIFGEKNKKLSILFLENKIVSSNSDFKRLVDGGSITILETDEKIKDYNTLVVGGVYKIGKKRFCRIIIK
jgi:tyrosyl-tRNA synthetase